MPLCLYKMRLGERERERKKRETETNILIHSKKAAASSKGERTQKKSNLMTP